MAVELHGRKGQLGLFSTLFLGAKGDQQCPGVQHSWAISTSELTCQEPEQLRGSRPTSLDPTLFTCPCQSVALNDTPCLCTLQPSNKWITLDCRQPNVTQIPDIQLVPGYGINLKCKADVINGISATVGNAITSLDLSGTELSSFENSPWWTSVAQYLPNLARLDLSHNRLSTVPSAVLDTWNGSRNLIILLSGNPWDCCSNRLLLEVFFSLRSRVEDYDEITCTSGENLATAERTCPASLSLRDAIVAVPLLALAFLVVFILVYRYRKTLRAWLYNRGICLSCVTKEEEEDDDRNYDVSDPFLLQCAKFIFTSNFHFFFFLSLGLYQFLPQRRRLCRPAIGARVREAGQWGTRVQALPSLSRLVRNSFKLFKSSINNNQGGPLQILGWLANGSPNKSADR